MNALAMSSPTLAQRYIDAWNEHDAGAIAACFAPAGSYSDPLAGESVGTAAMAAHAGRLFAAFPDLFLEIVSIDACGGQGLAIQWIARGSHGGPYLGHPATGRVIELPGALFIRMGADGIRSARAYFDAAAILRQLGVAPAPQPCAAGPFSFGLSTRIQSGRKRKPGAITVTRLSARDAGDAEALQEAGCELAQDLLGRPGFLSATVSAVGDEVLAIAAWDSVEAVEQLRDPRHRQVMSAYFGPEVAAAAATSVWAPAESSALWVRCDSCGSMADSTIHGGTCACGARLAEPAPCC